MAYARRCVWWRRLCVQIADPYLSGEGTTKIKKGYNGVYPYIRRSCMGLYAEITDLAPGVKHAIKVTLPEGLAPGQFQGLFFEHVEEEFTTELLTPARTAAVDGVATNTTQSERL